MNGDARLADLPSISVQVGERCIPRHRVPITIAGRRAYGWLLRTIEADKSVHRRTLVIRKPSEVVGLLPGNVGTKWKSFLAEIELERTRWQLRGVPLLKRIVRCYRAASHFAHYPLTTVVHRYGAVPALLIGRTKEYAVALLPEHVGRQQLRGAFTGDELQELLTSYDDFLPLMLPAYYEQIDNYMKAVFFGGPDRSATAFCLRIRQIIAQSIRTKLENIRTGCSGSGESKRLADQITSKYATQLREAEAVDHFAHLMVNYVYRFFCIKDRVEDYHERLSPLPTARDLYQPDSVGLIKRCAQNLRCPDDRFLDDLAAEEQHREEWLFGLAESSAFIAEIINYTRMSRVDAPALFLSRHFRVVDSERFAFLLANTLRNSTKPVTLVQGRHLGRDIRWSILARVWFSDHQVLFLPASYTKTDGTEKATRTHDDWVMLELLYGKYLGRDLTVVVAAPENGALIEQFREQLRSYTSEREINQIPAENWGSFVAEAKQRLVDRLHTVKYLTCELDKFEDGAFVKELEKQAVEPAARRLVETLFTAWCYFFSEDRWSIVQAAAIAAKGDLFNPPNTEGPMSVRDIATVLWKCRSDDARFAWATRYDSLDAIERAVRDHLGELESFAFVFGDTDIKPLLVSKKGRKLQVFVRIEKCYAYICERLGVIPSADHLGRVREDLMVERVE